MPASTAKTHRPLILTATPHQLESKFLTQRDKPTLNARIKVRRKKHETPLELNVNVSNPFYQERRTSWVKDHTPPGEVAGTGFTHNTPADTEMRGCIEDCMKKRHARVRAAKEEQEGGRLIKSKKLRKKLQQGSLALQAGALGAAALGQPELAAPLEGTALAAQALSGLGKSKTGKILRGIHEVSNASRGIETRGYGTDNDDVEYFNTEMRKCIKDCREKRNSNVRAKKSKKKARYELQSLP